MGDRVDRLLALADDELILGWRNSEWTGIAPSLEEDVAFSSIAQNEIGHARALYELAARELGTDADALAFDRKPDEYRSAPLVELRRLEWARTIARHWLYELADEIRLAALKASHDEAIDELWPYALGVLDDALRPELRARAEERLGRALPDVEPVPRGAHEAELSELWEEMTSVRRSAPAGAQW